jgi:hypothetical protein
LNHHYVTFHKTHKSGYQVMREKIMKHYENKMKMVYIDQNAWENLKSNAEKVQYLNKLGLQLALTK